MDIQTAGAGSSMSITRNVSLSQREDDIVAEFARTSGIGAYSAALRVIINQWYTTTQAQTVKVSDSN